MKNILRSNKNSILLGIIIFSCSFFIERLYFSHSVLSINNGFYVGIKIALFFLIQGFCLLLFYVIKKINEQDEHYIFASKVFLIYFGIMMFLVFLLWPGLWRDDEFHILSGCKDFYMNPYQHYMTSCMYILFLMLIPCAAGIIILEQVIYALIVAYFAFNLHKFYFSSKKVAICLLPFFFIPVLDSNLYPMRCCVYAMIELFFGGLVLFQYKKNAMSKSVFCILYAVSSIILAVWRSEGIYYLLISPLIFLLFFKKKINKMSKMLVLASIIISASAGIYVQNSIAQRTIGDRTFIISTLGFTYHEQARGILDQRNDISDDLDNVIDLNILREHGVGAIWSDLPLVKEPYTREQYKGFQLAYIRLVLYDTKEFIKYCWGNYLESNGLGNIFLGDTATLYDGDSSYAVRQEFLNGALNGPMFPNVRKRIISMVEFRDKNDKNSVVVRFVLYNSIIPLAIIVILVCLFCVKREWVLATLGCIALIKIPIIFALSPSNLFMYYYSVYLEGYVIGICVLVGYSKNRHLTLR